MAVDNSLRAIERIFTALEFNYAGSNQWKELNDDLLEYETCYSKWLVKDTDTNRELIESLLHLFDTSPVKVTVLDDKHEYNERIKEETISKVGRDRYEELTEANKGFITLVVFHYDVKRELVDRKNVIALFRSVMTWDD